jgi:predicted ArsR family transcriptional regulator
VHDTHTAASAARDAYGNCLRILAAVRDKPASAYKVGLQLGVRCQAARRVLDDAVIQGMVKVVGRTRKGFAVYGWADLKDWGAK